MPNETPFCLVCCAKARILDTLVESSTPERVVRMRLVECALCGTVRRYRVVTEVTDLGDDPKRYLRGPSAAGTSQYSRVKP